MSESRREVAESIVLRGLPFSAFRNEQGWKDTKEWMTNAIEAALKDRDERAANIVNDARFEGEHDLRSMAHAIRNEDTK